MKRFFCVLLVWALLPLTAWAEDPSAVDIAALMARQVSGNSTFRAQLTAELSEQAPAGADAALWALLSAAVRDASLESSFIFSRAGETLGNSQTTLTLKRGEDALSTLRLAGRGDTWQLWGDGTEGKVWQLPRDTGLLLRDRYLTLEGWGQVLLRDLGFEQYALNRPEEGQWPALYRFFTQAFTEDAAWREEANGYLKKYTDQVSAWMQTHTAVSLRRTGGELSTVSELRATAEELKEEALSLLRQFYKDTGFLTLLRDKMTDLEAKSYLEPGMLLLFEQTLGQMTLPGDFVLSRSFLPDGGLESLSLSMPLPDGTALLWEQRDGADIYGLDRGDLSLRLSVQGDAAGGWQGDFSFTAGETRLAGGYQLFASLEPVYEEEDGTGRQRRQNGALTLLITPAEAMPFAAQSFTFTLTAWAGLQNDQPAHWNLALDWQELGGGAYARVNLKTRTGAAVQQTEAEGEPMPLAELQPAERQALLARLAQAFFAPLLSAD